MHINVQVCLYSVLIFFINVLPVPVPSDLASKTERVDLKKHKRFRKYMYNCTVQTICYHSQTKYIIKNPMEKSSRLKNYTC